MERDDSAMVRLQDVTAVVLCGGKSRRMGLDKSLLPMNGVSFIQTIASQLGSFREVVLATGSSSRYHIPGTRNICDEYIDCGPLGALYSAFVQCESEFAFTVPCDLPLFTTDLAHRIVACMDERSDVVVPITPDGRFHPLCACYRTSIAPVLKQELDKGRFKVMKALETLRLKNICIEDDSVLMNINTPEDYSDLKNYIRRKEDDFKEQSNEHKA